MARIFGEYFDIDKSQEYLTINFSPNRLSITDRWRNNGLSADFLADYWSTFFPSDDYSSQKNAMHIKNIVGYIANELLENGMKFHSKTSDLPISISIHLFPDELILYMKNCADAPASERFQSYITMLLNENIEELYLRQLENNAQETEHTTSQMGFLTMVHDYQAGLAWKFEPLSEAHGAQQVSTMVRLML